jgi:hypothetical protein
MKFNSTEFSSRAKRLTPTAFLLMMLEPCESFQLNEAIVHSLAHLVCSQLPEDVAPSFKWTIRGNLLFSPHVARSLALARQQGLVSLPPSVALSPMGKKHCSLFDADTKAMRTKIQEATVATIGLSRHNLHRLTVAAAVLAIDSDRKEVADPEINNILNRHTQYVHTYQRL